MLRNHQNPPNKVQQIQDDESDSDNEVSAHAIAGPPPKPWNPLSGLKFPCPLRNHKHKVSSCVEFFNLTPSDRWEMIEKNKMCYTCLKPRTVCKGRRCLNTANVPEVLKCAVCAWWAESKGSSLFSIFFSKQKQHGDSRAQLSKELEKYIGKLGSMVADSKIQFSVNYMFQKMKKTKKTKSTQDEVFLLPALTFDSETGEVLKKDKLEIQSESSENSIYMIQNLRIGNSNRLTFFVSTANAHLIEGTLVKREN